MRVLLAVLLIAVPLAPAWAKPVTTEELQHQLAERDRIIMELQRRVEVLENGRHAMPSSQVETAPSTAANKSNGDNRSEADEDVALQALSRTLVTRGALVLPKGTVEVAPSVTYSHNQTAGLVLVPTPDGFSTVDSQRLRDDHVKASLTARIGLPWNSEFEIRLPYAWMQESVALGDGTHSVNTKSGIGDIDAELSHQILREDGWKPDLVGAISVRFPTGKDPFRSVIPNIASGNGTYALGGRLTALKSADPMVFFVTAAYVHDFSVNEPFGRLQLGDTFKFDLGGILAVSPKTSLTADFVQQFIGRSKVASKSVPGTDRVASSVQLGVDYVLAPKVLLDLSLALGVTSDAPDYTLLFSVPVRF